MINVDKTIQEICLLLRTSRICLGIYPSEKGLYAGDLTIVDENNQNLISYTSLFEKAFLTTHDLLSDNYKFKSCAKFVLVVEKETILKSIISSKNFEMEFVNSIVISVFIHSITLKN